MRKVFIFTFLLVFFFVTLSFAENLIKISGSQRRGRSWRQDAELRSEPVNLPSSGKIVRVEGGSRGFWVSKVNRWGQSKVANFSTPNEAMGFSLDKGTYAVYPNLPGGEDKEEVAIYVKLEKGVIPKEAETKTRKKAKSSKSAEPEEISKNIKEISAESTTVSTRIKEGEKLYEKALEAGGQEQKQLLAKALEIFIKAGKEAEREATAEDKVGLVKSYYMRAFCYRGLGKADEAARSFLECRDLALKFMREKEYASEEEYENDPLRDLEFEADSMLSCYEDIPWVKEKLDEQWQSGVELSKGASGRPKGEITEETMKEIQGILKDANEYDDEDLYLDYPTTYSEKDRQAALEKLKNTKQIIMTEDGQIRSVPVETVPSNLTRDGRLIGSKREKREKPEEPEKLKFSEVTFDASEYPEGVHPYGIIVTDGKLSTGFWIYKEDEGEFRKYIYLSAGEVERLKRGLSLEDVHLQPGTYGVSSSSPAPDIEFNLYYSDHRY